MTRRNFEHSYDNVEFLFRDPIQIVRVGDTFGAQLSDAVEELNRAHREYEISEWEVFLSRAKWLRWHLSHTPVLSPAEQPNWPFLSHLEKLRAQAEQLKTYCAGVSQLDAFIKVLDDFESYEGNLARVLKETVWTFGVNRVAVIAANPFSIETINQWLDYALPGARAQSLAAARTTGSDVDIAVAVGPARSFSPSIYSAPVAPELTFIQPQWFRGTSLPVSRFAEKFEIFRQPPVKEFYEYVSKEEWKPAPLDEVEDFDLNGLPDPPDLDAAAGENSALCRKVLFSGGYYSWLEAEAKCHVLVGINPVKLDDVEVAALGVSDIAILRMEGLESEHLRMRAFDLLGDEAERIADTQKKWKEKLTRELNRLGPSEIERRFSKLGIKVSGGAPRWISSSFIHPQCFQLRESYQKAWTRREGLFE